MYVRVAWGSAGDRLEAVDVGQDDLRARGVVEEEPATVHSTSTVDEYFSAVGSGGDSTELGSAVENDDDEATAVYTAGEEGLCGEDGGADDGVGKQRSGSDGEDDSVVMYHGERSSDEDPVAGEEEAVIVHWDTHRGEDLNLASEMPVVSGESVADRRTDASDVDEAVRTAENRLYGELQYLKEQLLSSSELPNPTSSPNAEGGLNRTLHGRSGYSRAMQRSYERQAELSFELAYVRLRALQVPEDVLVQMMLTAKRYWDDTSAGR